MAENITLTNLVNLQNPTTVVNAINANNSIITTAFQDVLSRSGTAPNFLTNQLDMNNNQIINLPAPTSSSSPLRVQDATTLNGNGTITVNPLPTGGTTGQVLTKNSATNFDTSWQTPSTNLTTYAAPFTGSVGRTFGNKLSDVVTVLDFGASTTGADSTVAFNNATASGAGAVIVPPGTYNLSGNWTIPSNIFVWIQKNAFITNTGGRITSYTPGGGNIALQIDGKCAFLATTTAPSQGGTAGWDYNSIWNNRGIIEFGGSVAAPANQIWIYGVGEVYSDYVWPGTPPSSFTNMNFQMNRKGICLFNTSDCCINGLNVHNIYGEAVYAQPGATGYINCQFLNNHVHEVAFNGLNFNVIGAGYNFIMRGNYIQNCWQAIEASTGTIDNNYALTATSGMITGGGGGGAPMRITNNVFHTCTSGINVAFSSTQEDFIINGNQIHNPGANGGITLNNLSTFQACNNTVYNGFLITNPFTIGAAMASGLVANNIIRAGSNNITNNAGGTVTLVNNYLV